MFLKFYKTNFFQKISRLNIISFDGIYYQISDSFFLNLKNFNPSKNAHKINKYKFS